MAATSLWHIEGRLKDLISYVENPEKTVPNKEMQDFFDVFSYVKNPQKTDNGEFVSAINCLKETALQQMILTKKQYQKTGGYIAWHGYQSFKPDEVTPENKGISMVNPNRVYPPLPPAENIMPLMRIPEQATLCEKIGGTEYTVTAHFREDGRDLLGLLSRIFMRDTADYSFDSEGYDED